MNPIEKYIEEQPEEVRPLLYKVRETILNTVPEASETISWRMPTFKLNGKNLIHFAAFKNHIGIYPGPEAIEFFSNKLTDYETSKGTIRFPYKNEIPYNIIEDIVKHLLSKRAAESE